MYKSTATFALGLALSQLVAGQGNPIPLPAVTDNGSGGSNGCGGCYVVADIAGVAFGTETITATQTDLNLIQTGLNGTYTTTSVIFNQGQFTIAPTGLVAASPAPTAGVAYNTDQSTVVISGVTLTSPTAYNVFTAYSLTSTTFSNGACLTVAGSPSILTSAFSVPIPAGGDPVSYALAAQQAFVDFINKPSCSLSAVDISATTHIPVSVETTAVTSYQSGRFTPQPATVSTVATMAQTSFSGFNATRPSGTGAVSYTGKTIQAAGAARNTVFGGMFGGLVAFIAGVVA